MSKAAIIKKEEIFTERRLNNCIDNLSREPLSGPHIKKITWRT
jgi:hypothetical protein